MSHTCPTCGQACNCNGDIEDHDTGEEFTEECSCCDGAEDDVAADFIPPVKRACRKCGCTDDDCRQCIQRTGFACWWVEKDLCSACTEPEKVGK